MSGLARKIKEWSIEGRPTPEPRTQDTLAGTPEELSIRELRLHGTRQDMCGISSSRRSNQDSSLQCLLWGTSVDALITFSPLLGSSANAS